jgi:Fe2+ transport system protein FeoA
LQSLLKDLRADISAQRLRHSLAQARLAALGLARGAEVVVEPSKSGGGPGDVLVRAGGCEIFVEIVSSLPTPNQDEMAYDDHVMWLWRQNADVSWAGYVPGYLDEARERTWRASVGAAVARCLETGDATDVDFDSGRLTTRRRADAGDGSLIGPDVSVDQSRRLAGVIDRKAAQTRGRGLAWIWIEDHGGLHQLTPFSAMGIEDKLSALAEFSRPLLQERQHVAGLVWTRATRSGDLVSDDVASPFGMAVKRPLGGGRVRESIVVHRDLVLPEQLNLIARILDREPQWLDWAFEELGAGTLAQCIRRPRN